MKASEEFYKNFVKTEWQSCPGPPRCTRAPKPPELHLADTPILVVGIGGTGIDAALAMKDRLEATYCAAEASKVEYLFIDTDEIPSGKKVKESEKIIIQSTDTAMMLREFKMAGNHRDDILPAEISSWLDGRLSPFRVMNGAAGIRQAGRLILFLNIQRIYCMLERKINKIRVGYDLKEKRVQVYLFTGIGGGTGSGMFVDISYLIREICRSNANLEGIVFMPDVSCLKPGLRKIHQENIQRNGFAALKELDYLMTLDRFREGFSQDYPGNIHLRFPKTPIFDFCVLVGAQKDGSCSVGSEMEIYRAVADYVLLEVQEREHFGVESYKSNIYNLQPREPFCDQHVAIGASSRYIPFDSFYSWWLTDVLQRIANLPDPHSELTAAFEQDFRTWIRQLDYAAPKLFHGIFSREKHSKQAEDDLKVFWEKPIKQKSGIFSAKVLAPFLLFCRERGFAEVESLLHAALNEISLSDLTWKRWTVKWAYKKKDLRKVYGNTYVEAYRSQLENYFEIMEEYGILHGELLKELESYDQDISSEFWIVGRKEFNKLSESPEYQASVEQALEDLYGNILDKPARWQGGCPDGDPKWLSEYISKLLANAFQRSGCMSPDKMLELLADNGCNGQEACLSGILNSLTPAQLWPRSATCPQKEDSHTTAAVPNTARIQKWTENWRGNSSNQDNVNYSKIMDRFVRAIIVPGNAMYSFAGLKQIEEIYISASNKAGLHLYAGEGKNWALLPSPYFETKWEEGDETTRQEEKERNKTYRNIFNDAVDAGIIQYRENIKQYVITIDSADGEEIPVGDISGTCGDPKYEALVKNMFIHMFTHRDAVKRRVDAYKDRKEKEAQEAQNDTAQNAR